MRFPFPAPRCGPGLIALLIVAGAMRVTAAETDNKARRPVAIVTVPEHRAAIVINERSGSLSWIDLDSHQIVRETTVGRQLTHGAWIPARSVLLITETSSHELLAVRLTEHDASVVARLSVAPFPVSVTVSADGNIAAVASLWSRRVTCVDLNRWLTTGAREDSPILAVVSLPFAPRALLPDALSQRLIIADAFGPHVATLTLNTFRLESVRELPVHAMRQLQPHPTQPRILVSHQSLNPQSETTRDDIHWGNLVTNGIRSIPLAALQDPKVDLARASHQEFLGGPEQGAADPAGFVIRPDGSQAVVLSGTDEVVFDDGNHLYARRVRVGACPTAIALSPEGQLAYVANTLDDSVSVIDMKRRLIQHTIPLGAPRERDAVERGERAFRNARLSHDNWFSCASCHVDGHTNGLLTDNSTDGSSGTAKRILTLRGIADTAPYAWNGRFTTLGQQIQHSSLATMQGPGLTVDEAADLAAYLRSLTPPPPVGGEQPLIDRGRDLFARWNCGSCHTAPAMTSAQVVEVGLKDELGQTRYNPPSLRGVSQNGPYFHDGRARTLESVFSRFLHQLNEPPADDDVRALVAYLNSL